MVLITFEKKGSEALVGFVLLADKVAAMRRFLAKVDPGAPSRWRADDGCEFPPTAYRVPFALNGPGAHAVRAEGQTVELLTVKGTMLEPGPAASRYWSPP